MKNFYKVTMIIIVLVLMSVLFISCEAQTFVLSFDTNYTEEIENIENNGEDDIDLPQPQRTGYTFEGWFLDNETFENEYTGSPLSEDTLVYAKWELNQYTLSFDANGGSAIGDLTASYNDDLLEPDQPQREGYTFEGWFADSDLENEFSFDTMPAQDITVYANWEAISYTITYELDGGENNQDNPQTYTIETRSFELLSATKEHHTFGGWFVDSDFENEITDIGGDQTGDITLYAKWIDGVVVDGIELAFNDYTNSYVVTGGQEKQNLVIPSQHNGYPVTMIEENAFYGSDIIENVTIPLTIVYINDSAFENCSNLTEVIYDENYDLEGWYQDEIMTQQFEFGLFEGEEKTIYAKWQNIDTPVKYNIEIVYPDGSPWRYNVAYLENQNMRWPILQKFGGLYYSSIGNSVFKNTALIDINMPDTITTIGSSAFENTDLVEVTLPESLILMGSYIFRSCSTLETVYVERKIDYRDWEESHDWMGTHGTEDMFDACLELENIYVYRENGDAPWWREDWEEWYPTVGAQDGVMVYQSHPYWRMYDYAIKANPNELPPQ